MTARLLLLRHGETDSNVEGVPQGRREVPLNDRGRRQAAAVVEMLRGYQPVAAYSSPSGRARETVAPAAEALGLEVAIDERLAELDQGELDGLTPQEMRERHPEFLQQWRGEGLAEVRMPGGESMADAQRRMVAATESIAEAHADQTVVVVSHNLALGALLCHALGVPLAGFRRFRRDLASLSVVDVHEGQQFVVVTLNERCFLPEDAG